MFGNCGDGKERYRKFRRPGEGGGCLSFVPDSFLRTQQSPPSRNADDRLASGKGGVTLHLCGLFHGEISPSRED